MDPSKDPTKPGSAAHLTKSDKPLTLLEKLIAVTPVVLSVVATVLAGLSSREMTLAQYHRSQATQSQSKAGDQWALFQAKRVRETSLRTTLDLLEVMSPPEKVTPERLREASDRLVSDFTRAASEANQVTAAAAAAKDSLGDARPDVERAVRQVNAALAGKVEAAQKARERTREALAAPGSQAAFSYLATGTMPDVTRRPITDRSLRQAVDSLKGHKPDKDWIDEVNHLSRDLGVLEQAIDDAQANLADFEAASEPVEETLRALDQQITAGLVLVRPLSRAVQDLRLALAGVPANGDLRLLGELWTSSAKLARTAEGLKLLADSLYGDVKAAHHEFTARRYGKGGDSTLNQEAALLYEVQVRCYSVESEKHRSKSYFIFYCMIGAQAGVTIATLSLAMRRKNVLWSFATVAGLTALLFATYVFLGM